MSIPIPSPRRRNQAALTFVLALAATSLLWNGGRDFGHQEALRPTPSPVPATTAFDSSATTSDYARKLAALRIQRPRARTPEEKSTLAGAFVTLAREAHFQNKGEGVLSLAAYDDGLALFREAKNQFSEADAIMNRAETVAMLGNPAEAESGFRTALALFRTLPSTALQQAEAALRLGERLCTSGKYTEARLFMDQSLRIRQRANETNGQADCLSALGRCAFEEGQFGLSRQLLGEAARLFTSLGKTPARAAVLGQLGDVALAEGELAEADRLYVEGLAVWEKRDQGYWVGRFLARQAQLALMRKDLARAQTLAQKSHDLLAASNGPTQAAWPLMVLGQVAKARGASAEGFFAQAEALHRQQGRAYGLRLLQEVR